MLRHRGLNRGSFVTGASVHNQRIERLWRDVRRVVMQYFSNIFYFIEGSGLLDLLNERDLFALHFVYIARINRACEQLIGQLNNHPMRTSSNQSPIQLFFRRCVELYGVQSLEAADIYNFEHDVDNNTDPIDLYMYGIENDVETAASDIDNDIYVPTINFCADEHTMQRLNQLDILRDDFNHGINIYEYVKSLIMLDQP